MRKRSESAFDLAGTEAARADVDAFDLAVDDRADALDVRLPGTLRLQVGVADVVARELAFVADFANMCHVDTPPCFWKSFEIWVLISFFRWGAAAPAHNECIIA